jgi:leader peptidase (prepilin peptidase)/N-methyltransferase
MVPVVLGALTAMGACVGSFLNVVAYRLPRECMSIVRPRSRCPGCRRPIPWFENLPVLSWILLRGRCSGCRERIPVRYPAVEAATAGLFALVASLAFRDHAWEAGRLPPLQAWIDFSVGATITSALLALSLIDWDHRILPDELTKPGMVLGPILAFAAPRWQHGRPWLAPFPEGPWAPRLNACVSGAAGLAVAGGVLWLVGAVGARAFKKEAMGQGDVKMMAAMGGVLGLWALLALGVASVLGAVAGIVHRLVTKDRYIPFGPFLALGMWLVMWFGPWIFDGWFSLFAPARSR